MIRLVALFCRRRRIGRRRILDGFFRVARFFPIGRPARLLRLLRSRRPGRFFLVRRPFPIYNFF
jgi:hypothetical protein